MLLGRIERNRTASRQIMTIKTALIDLQPQPAQHTAKI